MARKRTAGALVHNTLPSYTYITPTGLFCYIIRTKNEKIMEVHDNNTAAAERGELGETAMAPSPQSNTCKRTARITRFSSTVYCEPFLNRVTNVYCREQHRSSTATV